MRNRHTIDTAILAGLALGHIAVAAAIARTIHAAHAWAHRNDR